MFDEPHCSPIGSKLGSKKYDNYSEQFRRDLVGTVNVISHKNFILIINLNFIILIEYNTGPYFNIWRPRLTKNATIGKRSDIEGLLLQIRRINWSNLPPWNLTYLNFAVVALFWEY